MTILGSGRVAVGARGTGGYLHVDEALPDLAVIVHDGSSVSIEVKVANALQRDNTLIAPGRLEVAAAPDNMVAFIQQLHRYLKVKQIFVTGELVQGRAVIHTKPSSVLSRAQALAAQGAIEVSQRLRRLRDQGKIDE